MKNQFNVLLSPSQPTDLWEVKGMEKSKSNNKISKGTLNMEKSDNYVVDRSLGLGYPESKNGRKIDFNQSLNAHKNTFGLTQTMTAK